MSQEITVTGQEMLAYAGSDANRWKTIQGHRIYFLDKGFGVIEPLEGCAKFRIVFGIKKRYFWQRRTIDEIFVGVDAFMTGYIAHILFDSLPADWVRQPRVANAQDLPQNPALPEYSTVILPVSLAPNLERLAPLIEAVAQLSQNIDTQARIASFPTSREIHDFCLERGIANIIHFTREENLDGILSRGLVNRTSVDQFPVSERPVINDIIRADRQKDSISVSISFPNYKMFYKYRKRDTAASWVVLKLSATILWELDCAFCIRNAASREVSETPLQDRKAVVSLRQMFGDFPDMERSVLHIPESYTTDPQAEVLVFETIDPSMINMVCFSDQKNLSDWQQTHVNCTPQPKFGVDNRYFRSRKDYTHWPTADRLMIPVA